MHDKNYLLGLRWLSGVALPHCHSDGTASTSSQWKRRKRIAEEGLTAVQQLCGASIRMFDCSYSFTCVYLLLVPIGWDLVLRLLSLHLEKKMFAKFIDFWKGKFDKWERQSCCPEVQTWRRVPGWRFTFSGAIRSSHCSLRQYTKNTHWYVIYIFLYIYEYIYMYLYIYICISILYFFWYFFWDIDHMSLPYSGEPAFA